ncbi:MAG TPA: FtsX-like permease family protein [Vicinamibacteria bacterium]
MATFLLIAFRNIFRNTRRTALTVLVISFGAVALILSGGFFVYNFDGLRETTIRNGLGHLQIHSERYLAEGEERPLLNGLPNYAALQQWLESQPHVFATTGQIDFVGLISNGEKSEAFLGTGVDPEQETRMGFSMNLKEGEPLGAEDEALLGTGLAASLKVHPGDVLTVMGTTSDGALNAVDVKVVGMYSVGIKEFDARALKVSLGTAQRLLNTDRVTKVIVKLDSTRNTEPVREALVAAGLGPQGGGLRVRPWHELAVFYKQVVLLYNAIFLFLGVIIFILVVLSSSNTMMMSVFERVREIGTLMAFGTRRRQVLAIFVLEGAVLGVLGGLCGLAISYGLIQLINHAGLTMPPPPSFSTGFPLLVKPVPALFAAVFALIVAVLTASAVAPAWRGARLRIVDALGHV